MKGLEISKGYFEEFALPALKRDFAHVLPFVAVGRVGPGSDNFGFDDEISRDHDFEPGFCIFLPDESLVDRRSEFLLMRMYSKLPAEYRGAVRQTLAPVGGARCGVMRTSDFYTRAVGSPDGRLSLEAWLRIPCFSLAEAVNGEVWLDNYGEFTSIRNRLSKMPEDVRLKRLAGSLITMGQSGQYNYLRCLGHGEPEAAQLSLNEFVTSSMKAAFLLCEAYMPYYKWSFRALRMLDGGAFLSEKLFVLLSGDIRDAACAEKRAQTVEEISTYFIEELKKRGLTEAVCSDLEKHAYSVNDRIKDGTLRNMSIFAGA